MFAESSMQASRRPVFVKPLYAIASWILGSDSRLTVTGWIYGSGADSVRTSWFSSAD